MDLSGSSPSRCKAAYGNRYPPGSDILYFCSPYTVSHRQFENKKAPEADQCCMLAMTYSPFKESTIGARRLNFRVRNENGWTPSAESPTYKTHQRASDAFLLHESLHAKLHILCASIHTTLFKIVTATYSIPYKNYVLLVHLGSARHRTST